MTQIVIKSACCAPSLFFFFFLNSFYKQHKEAFSSESTVVTLIYRVTQPSYRHFLYNGLKWLSLEYQMPAKIQWTIPKLLHVPSPEQQNSISFKSKLFNSQWWNILLGSESHYIYPHYIYACTRYSVLLTFATLHIYR